MIFTFLLFKMLSTVSMSKQSDQILCEFVCTLRKLCVRGELAYLYDVKDKFEYTDYSDTRK